MASNKVEIDVKTSDGGSTRKVALGAKKLGSALDQGAKSAGELDRNVKGVAGASSNATKNFSKMSQGMGGVVQVYATLAANAFALGAAFNALQRNRALAQLEEGLNAVGRAAGQNLPYVAEQLREITDGALSTEQSFRTVATGISAGFDPGQLQRLAGVAKGASLALGRDLPDALDRLVRGTAKVEPEILDELGIFVRLDDATEDYAATLGKTAGQLTQFERSQAFLNATLDQGEKKFALIASQVDVNPYDQLLASLRDLQEGFLDIVSVVATPFVTFLSDSKLALTGVIALFGSTISGSLIGSIEQQIDGALAHANNAVQRLEQLREGTITEFDTLSDKVSKKGARVGSETFQKEILPTITDAGVSEASRIEATESALKSLQGTRANYTREINKVQKEIDALKGKEDAQSQAAIKGYQAQIRGLKNKRREVQNLESDIESLSQAETLASTTNLELTAAETAATTLQREAEVLQSIQAAGLGAGLGIKEAAKESANLFKNAKGLPGMLTAAGKAFDYFKVVMLRALPYIGAAAVAIGAVTAAFKYFTKKTMVEEKVDSIIESFAELAEISANYQSQMAIMTDANEQFGASLAVLAGVLGQIKGAFQSLQQTQTEQMVKTIQDAIKVQQEAAKMTSGEVRGMAGPTGGAVVALAAAEGRMAQDDINEAKKAGVAFDEASALAITESYAALIRSDKVLRELVPPAQLDKIVELPKQGHKTLSDFIIELSKIVDPILSADAAFKNLDNTVSSFNKGIITLFDKQRTEYSQTIDNITAIQNELKAIQDGSEAEVDFSKLPESLQKALSEMSGYSEEFLTMFAGEKYVNNLIEDYKKKFEEADKEVRQHKNTVKLLGIELKDIQTIRKDAPEVEGMVLRIQKNILAEKNKELSSRRELAKLINDENLKAQALAQIKVEQAVLDSQAVSAHEETRRLVEARVDLMKIAADFQKRELDLLKRGVALEEKRSNIAIDRQLREDRQGSAFGYLGEDRRRAKLEYQAAVELAKKREESLMAEMDLKKLQNEIEYTLLDAKYAFLEAELRAKAKMSGLTQTEIDSLNAAADRVGNQRNALGVDSGYTDSGEFYVRSSDPEGLFARTQQLIIQETNTAIDEQRLKVEQLGEAYAQSKTWFQFIDAGKRALSDGLGRTLEEIIRGTKSAKEAFADLAISILDSMSKVMMDRITEDFLNFLFPPKSGTTSTPGTTAASSTAAAATGSVVSGVVGKITGGGQLGTQGNPMYVICMKGGAGGEGPSSIVDNVLNKDKEKDGAVDEITKPGFWETLVGKKGTTETTMGIGVNPNTGLPIEETITKNIAGSGVKGLFDDFSKDMGLLFSGEAPFLSSLGGLFSNLLGNMGGIFNTLLGGLAGQGGAGFLSLFGFKNGGIMDNGKKVPGYSTGGIANGSKQGHLAMLHGKEAIVPLGNGNSIPVQMQGGGSQQNNVTVNVAIDNNGKASSTSQGDTSFGNNLGGMIAQAVQKELQDQKRSGGILNPYGSA